jgi:branched-chain amino acid transport system substrate-binding protein
LKAQRCTLAFLQRVRDQNPYTLFVWFPGPAGGIFAKQFVECALDKSGIRIMGSGDLTDDDELPGMTDAVRSSRRTTIPRFMIL